MDVRSLARYEEAIHRENRTFLKARGVVIPPNDPTKFPPPPIVDHGLIFHALHDHMCDREPVVKRIPTPEPNGFTEVPFDMWRKSGTKDNWRKTATKGKPQGPTDRAASCVTAATPSLPPSALVPRSGLS